jgi:hypothetical protein
MNGALLARYSIITKWKVNKVTSWHRGRGVEIFQKSKNNLRILGVGRVMSRKLLAEEPRKY